MPCTLIHLLLLIFAKKRGKNESNFRKSGSRCETRGDPAAFCVPTTPRTQVRLGFEVSNAGDEKTRAALLAATEGHDGQALRLAPPALKNDRDFVRECVAKSYRALRFASARLPAEL